MSSVMAERMAAQVAGRVFQQLGAMYGRRWADLWAGQDMAAVARTWAGTLARTDPGRIQRALEACVAREWPPTLPEFVALCRSFAEPAHALLALPDRTERAPVPAEVAGALQRAVAPRDDMLAWARRPRSVVAARTVIDSAAHSSDLRALVLDWARRGLPDGLATDVRKVLEAGLEVYRTAQEPAGAPGDPVVVSTPYPEVAAAGKAPSVRPERQSCVDADPVLAGQWEQDVDSVGWPAGWR